jgi:cyclase
VLKKRLIFILFYMDGYFYLSRNFVLQKVGDASWLIDKFKFTKIGDYVDELVIYDVSRTRDVSSDSLSLELSCSVLMSQLFVPLTIGGGIATIDDAQRYFEIGADKIAINTALTNGQLISDCVTTFGSQAVVASVDVKRSDDSVIAYTHNGQVKHAKLREYLDYIVSLNVGEICINSIDQDGTGMGFDLALLSHFPRIPVPVILTGGAGKPEHFVEALSHTSIAAVATGNLFNFIGNGFQLAREKLSEELTNVRRIKASRHENF